MAVKVQLNHSACVQVCACAPAKICLCLCERERKGERVRKSDQAEKEKKLSGERYWSFMLPVLPRTLFYRHWRENCLF